MCTGHLCVCMLGVWPTPKNHSLYMLPSKKTTTCASHVSYDSIISSAGQVAWMLHPCYLASRWNNDNRYCLPYNDYMHALVLSTLMYTGHAHRHPTLIAMVVYSLRGCKTPTHVPQHFVYCTDPVRLSPWEATASPLVVTGRNTSSLSWLGNTMAVSLRICLRPVRK